MSTTPDWNSTSATFYAAEEVWLEDWIDDEADDLDPADVAAFVSDVLARSDFRSWSPGAQELVGLTPPAIVWDVAEESTLAGYYDPTTDDLHLHPRLVRKSLILHELAHWIRPRPRDGEGHGGFST